MTPNGQSDPSLDKAAIREHLETISPGRHYEAGNTRDLGENHDPEWTKRPLP